MDVDTKTLNNGELDLESSLLQQFSCLATQDKEVLINEFQKLLSPNSLSPEGCAFFLDMNNWNLQQAIWSYFDFDGPIEINVKSLPKMTFVKDVTIGDGEEIPPNTRFIKTWRLQNSGDEPWPPCCSLRFINGHFMDSCENVIVDTLRPGQIVDVSIEMVSPSNPGMYQGQWRMCNAVGQFFGEVIWVIITVAEGGLLGLTQQMDSFHQLGSPVKQPSNEPAITTNPFALSTIKNNEDFPCNRPVPTIENGENLETKGFIDNFVSHSSPVSHSNQTQICDSNFHQKNNCSLTTSDTTSFNQSSNQLHVTHPTSEDMML